ncbi:STAS domain-containing protein [Streptomyces sp. VRA16 Mangrove soil]|uniref:STAS domain-containing protein n=1 Tax=Streptomyces sp. VRA16 Mangrove soil TaxID=2817434 RepID=UPI001A9EB78B|nr:STAS domain-containing protein [Streptomyces sp. VRA16 Mangrove soil]MBO1330403.1 STAS domain-containing protein [Streptomyces sp. VRA16 Mangrove soil]
MTLYAALNVTTLGLRDGVLRVRVAGALDYDTSEQLTRHVAQELETHPAVRTLCLDCTELGTVDSMGVSVLLSLRRRLDERGAALRLVERSARLDRLLSVTGTYEYLIGEATGERESTAADFEPGPP